MSLFASMNLQIAWLNSGTDAKLEWQWDGGHVPSEIFGESLALYIDEMYGKYMEGAAEITKAALEKQTVNGDAEEASGQETYEFGNTTQDARHFDKYVLKVLEEKGAVVEEFDLSLVKYAIPAYYVIASAEASSNLARFDGVKYGYRTEEYEGLHNMYKKSRSEGFGPEVKRRIMLGSFVLSSGYYDAYYLKALKTKALIKKAFDKAFEKYDVIVAPAAPTTAPELGKSLSDPIKMYLGDIYTISVNLAGLPGITIPVGKDSKGLPVGMQLIGNCFEENKIIQTAYTFEQTKAYEAPELAKEDR